MKNKSKTNVFIGTLPRSGSTLLGMMLNQHSNCFNMGESFFWNNFVPGKIKCSCGSKNCSILLNVFQKILQRKDILGFFNVCQALDILPEKENVILNNKIRKQINESCTDLNYLANIFREISSKNIIIDTSTNIRIAENLLSDENWKVILLVRDPRGVLYSCKKADIRHNSKEPLKRKINVFIDFAKKAILLKNNPKVLLVKYEDLCRKPSLEIVRISNFLNIDFEDDMLNFKKDLGHTVMGNRIRFDNKKNITEDLSWQKNLTKAEKRLITDSSEIVSLYKKLNYDF